MTVLACRPTAEAEWLVSWPGVESPHPQEHTLPILALHHVQLAMPPGGEAQARAARVNAVEPNAEMRQAAEDWLDDQPGFVSIDGSA